MTRDDVAAWQPRELAWTAVLAGALVLMSAGISSGCGGDEAQVKLPASGADMAGVIDMAGVDMPREGVEPIIPPDPEADMGRPRDMGGSRDMSAADMGAGDPDDPNDGWIGGACADATACVYDDAVCLTDGWPGGLCSQACDRFCPDHESGELSTTFCIGTAEGGRCASRCDHALFPETGCRAGLVCRVKSRHNEPSVQVPTCVPPSDPGDVVVSACQDNITAAGVPWTSWAYTTQHPAGDTSLSCTVDEPLRADSPINGVSYTYYNQTTPRPMSMGCALAEALVRLGDVLALYEIDTVLHIGTFNCRKISGSSRLSQHSHGLAIDIYGFIDKNGERYILEDHWEHDTDAPQTRKGRVLWEIAQAMHTQRIFNTVLTPNYNAGHDNHFHVDLSPNAHFIGQHQRPAYYLGSEGWETACPGPHGDAP